MAETAPVGTLLVTRPLDSAPLKTGEFVVFHPPTSPAETFAHRIVAIDADGTVHTKGDLNGAVDPWTLRRSDVTAHVIARLWGLGWLMRVIPVLLIAGVAVFAVCHFAVRARNRLPVGVLLMSLAVAITLVWLRPLVRADVLNLHADRQNAQATLVSTGLLPVRAEAKDAGSIVLRPGQDGALRRSQTGESLFRVDIVAHFTPVLWLLLVCCWLLPFGVLVAVGVRPREPATSHRALS